MKYRPVKYGLESQDTSYINSKTFYEKRFPFLFPWSFIDASKQETN